MADLIEDYAVIGNGETLALVSKSGSIDWLGFPRFDSPACFAALLGHSGNGRWLLAPKESSTVKRRYRSNTLIIETDFETSTGAVRITDFMARRSGSSDLFRLVKGLKGEVEMQTELTVRFDNGSVVPWASRRDDGRLQFIAGADRLLLETSVPLQGKDRRTLGSFAVSANQEVAFGLTWNHSFLEPPEPLNFGKMAEQESSFWNRWVSQVKECGDWTADVKRSLITLKALSHRLTGGIVAAGTTSLPEQIGGTRNWDYRYCWLRDATFTLYAFLTAGFLKEAAAWRSWLIRAIAGSPEDLQIMYGVAGERRLDEHEVDWLPGYEHSSPVRIGNAAAHQLQLDVFGEVIDALYVGRKAGLPADADSWDLECALLEHLETIWKKADAGIWEVRGPPRHFTHSKVMAWVAFDRAVRSIEEFGLKGPVERWRSLRDTIHEQVCDRGFNREKNCFVQHYDSDALDASLLLIPMVGFLSPEDRRIRGTVAAIEASLLQGGLVRRYHTTEGTDGLPPGEGAFLACSFWLVDNYVLQKRYSDAQRLFEFLLSLRNDVGLLAEEYDVKAKRQLGNFPQAFSHLALVNSAHNISTSHGPVHERSQQAKAK